MSARDLYRELGLELRGPDSGNASVRCFATPDAHRNGDRSASCSVNVETGAWNCHGCGAHGGAYDAAVAHDYSPADAMSLLKRHRLVEDDHKPTSKPRAKGPKTTDGQVTAYSKALLANDAALHRAGELCAITRDVVERFEVGLGPCPIGPCKGELRLVFPRRDATGRLVGAVFFQPNRELRTNGRKKSYADGPRGLWPASLPADKSRWVYVAEGEPAAAALLSIGITAVAVPGTESWRPENAEIFRGRPVCLLPDCDSKGRELARRAADDLIDVASDVVIVDVAPDRDDAYDVRDLLLERIASRGDLGRPEVRQFLEHSVRDAKPLARADLAPEPLVDLGVLSETTAEMLGDLSEFARRFVVISREQAVAFALWVLHTHAIDAAEATSYLAITSAEKQSGKTRLGIEIAGAVVANPIPTLNSSIPAIFRSIDKGRCTLLFDEMDAVWSGKGDNEELRGILNGGHKRGAVALRCVGEGAKQEPVRFPIFCPKALIGIGSLPETVADRSIPIRLKKRAPDEQFERARTSAIDKAGRPLRQRAQAWSEQATPRLGSMHPDLPAELSDRAQDGAEPLLAIADMAGGDWPQVARGALISLYSDPSTRGDDAGSNGTRLLAACRKAFDEAAETVLSTAALLEAINADDELPFGGWRHGEGLEARGLGKFLRPYGIRSRTVRVGDETPKGYRLESFEDAWARYLPLSPQAPQPAFDGDGDVADVADVAAPGEGKTEPLGTTDDGLLEAAERLEAKYGEVW